MSRREVKSRELQFTVTFRSPRYIHGQPIVKVFSGYRSMIDFLINLAADLDSERVCATGGASYRVLFDHITIERTYV